MREFRFFEIDLGETNLHLCAYDEFEPTDFTEYLTEEENARMLSFGSISRRREFVAARILRHRIFGFQHIHYDKNGAPYIKGTGFISISHSRNMVGLAINPNYKIGLDLESPRDNVLDIMPKFISKDEPLFFDTANPSVVTKIWSAKEALYKLAGRKKIHFKTELLLSVDKNGDWLGRIVNPENDILVKLNIFEHEGTVISINKAPVVEESRNT